MKLEIKHLASYLPYNVEVFEILTNKSFTLDEYGLYIMSENLGYENYKIHLRPLSSLTKEITHNGETFVPLERIAIETCPFFHGNVITEFENDTEENNCWCNVLIAGKIVWCIEYVYHENNFYQCVENAPKTPFQYECFQKLLEYSFDIFGLLDQNLAINLETLK